MGKLLIQKHNFDAAKHEIEKFSNKLPSNPSFDRVEVEGGLFGWGDHKVTGTEMNNFIGKVQAKLISVNTSLRSIIGEFREVYNAFDFLDGEYINGIIGSVESAEKASQQALQAQSDIMENVENLKKTVIGLVNLKNKIDSIEKVLNNKFEVSYDEISSRLSRSYNLSQISTIISDIEEISKAKEHVNQDIAALQQYRSILESYEHLGDVDVIWKDVEGHKVNLSDFNKQVDAFISETHSAQAEINSSITKATERIDRDIAALHQYRSILESYEHLGDVDSIWKDVEGHKKNLADFHQQVDAFIGETHSAEIEIKQSIKRAEERIDSNIADFHKQVEDFTSETRKTQDELKLTIKQAETRIDGDIAALQQYRSILESYEHLGDVDVIWKDVEGHKVNLSDFHKQVDAFIGETHSAEEEIKQAIKQTEERHDSDIADFHKQVDAFVSETHLTEDEIKKTIKQLEEANNVSHQAYEKRIKIAYYISGSAVGLTLINVILQLLGIL